MQRVGLLRVGREDLLAKRLAVGKPAFLEMLESELQRLRDGHRGGDQAAGLAHQSRQILR